MPPYSENPFAGLGGKRFCIEDAKRIFVFDRQTELKFLKAADDWSFPILFTLAKTGVRPGELTRLLIEELDLDAGWMAVRNKPELGWRGCNLAGAEIFRGFVRWERFGGVKLRIDVSTPISASPSKLTVLVAKSLNFLVLSTESVSRIFACFAISLRATVDAS